MIWALGFRQAISAIYHLGSYEMIIQESVEKSESGKKRNRQNAEWISCKEKEKETSGKRKKDKREYSAMKKRIKEGAGQRCG